MARFTESGEMRIALPLSQAFHAVATAASKAGSVGYDESDSVVVVRTSPKLWPPTNAAVVTMLLQSVDDGTTMISLSSEVEDDGIGIGSAGRALEAVKKELQVLQRKATAGSKTSTASSDQFAFLGTPSKPASTGQFDFPTNASSDAQQSPPKVQPAASAAANVRAGQERRWHVSIGGKQQGPLTDAELRAMASRGELTPDSHIWKNGMAQWAKASQLKGLFS
jgi:hypothetical protein